jgi:transposase
MELINEENGKTLSIKDDDKLAKKLLMIYEGELYGRKAAWEKYGYTEQWYYKLLKRYNEHGSEGLIEKKRGSDKKPVRTDEVTTQVISLRYLDPISDTGVIVQKMKQNGYRISQRSVERVITDYGLQKKRMFSTPKKRSKKLKLK